MIKFSDEKVLRTHVEYGDERSLKQAHQHVTPVVLVIRHSSVTHIYRKGHQEELDGGPEKSGPLGYQSGLNVELEGVGGGGVTEQRVVGFEGRERLGKKDSVYM